VCLSKLHKQKEARRAYIKAIELNGNNEIYYHSLGSCLMKLGRNKEAIAMFDKEKEIIRRKKREEGR
jgi:Flp pilus assembly protein TadD